MFSSQDLLNGVRMTQLNDPEAITWSDSALIIALNQALLMLALVRPDATSKIAEIDLSKGSRQFIPAGFGGSHMAYSRYNIGHAHKQQR